MLCMRFECIGFIGYVIGFWLLVMGCFDGFCNCFLFFSLLILAGMTGGLIWACSFYGFCY